MTCPICDQKPMNCDCTPRERAMYRELQERGEMPATVILTDAEREAIESAIWDYEQNDDDADCANMVATLRGLLDRLGHQDGRD